MFFRIPAPPLAPRAVMAAGCLAVLTAGSAWADGLACPASVTCRGDVCAPDPDGEGGVRIGPMGDGMAELALFVEGRPTPVSRTDDGKVVRFATADGAEILAVRKADLAFTYRSTRPDLPFEARGTCVEE